LKMKKLICLFFGAITILFIYACQDKHAKNYNTGIQVDTAGVSFINNGIEGGLAEIKASGLAITNSNNQRVIGLAKMMIDDHTKAGDDLKQIATDKKVDEKDTINAVHQQVITDLSKKSGATFDKAYLQMMVTDHEGAVRLFTVATQNADPDIKNFAAKTLPTIKMHLDSANAILTSLK
jgi:putative membrane protein